MAQAQVNRRVKKLLWHDWQLKIIKDNAGIKPIQEISVLVERSVSATKTKANKHGFSIAHPDNEV